MENFAIIYSAIFISIMMVSVVCGIFKLAKSGAKQNLENAKAMIVLGMIGVLFGSMALYTAVVI